MTWKHFVGACILAGGLLIKAGAPLPAIALGMAGAAAINWWQHRGPHDRAAQRRGPSTFIG